MSLNQLTTFKKIWLWGEINNETSKEVVQELISANSDVQFFICSEGGDLENGFAILDAIKICEKKNKVNVIGIGKVYSVAALIFCSSSIRMATKNTIFCFHSCYYDLHEDFVDRHLYFSKFSQANIKFLCKQIDSNLGWKPGNFHSLIKKETWMLVEDAIKRNIVQEVFNV